MSTAATDMETTPMEVTSTEVSSTEATSMEATSTEATTTAETSTEVTPSLTNPVKKKSHKKVVYTHKKCVIVKQGDVENSFTMDNIRRICRGCFTTTNLNCLFESSYKGERLNVILQKGFGIHIARSSRISTNICSTCIKKIGQFYKFVCKFRTSETVLVTSLHALEGNVSPEVNVLVEKETEPPNVVPITHINHSYSTDSLRHKRNYVRRATTTTNPPTYTVKKAIDDGVVVISDDEETDKVVSKKTVSIDLPPEANKATSAIQSLPLPLKSVSTVGTEITTKAITEKNKISEIIKTAGVKRGLEMGKKVELKIRKVNETSNNQPSICMPSLDDNSVDAMETDNGIIISTDGATKPTTIVILEYSCTKCVRHYPTKEELNLHEIQAHRQQMCDICQKICIGQKQLKRHFLGVHALKNSIVCSVCRRIFGVKDNYLLHKRNNCKDTIMSAAVQKEKLTEGERGKSNTTATKMKRKMSKVMEENNSSPSRFSTTVTEVKSMPVIIDTTMEEIVTSPLQVNKTMEEIKTTPSIINETLTDIPEIIDTTLTESTINKSLTETKTTPSKTNITLMINIQQSTQEVNSTPTKINQTSSLPIIKTNVEIKEPPIQSNRDTQSTSSLTEDKSTLISNINTVPPKIESILMETNIPSILQKLTPSEVTATLAAVKSPPQELSEINTTTKESAIIKSESPLTKPESSKSKIPPSVIKLKQSDLKAVLAAVKQSKIMKIASPNQVIAMPSETKVTTDSTITNTESLLTKSESLFTKSESLLTKAERFLPPPPLVQLTKSDIAAAMEAAKQPKIMKIASINKPTGFAKVRTDLLIEGTKVTPEVVNKTPTILNSGGDRVTTVLNLKGRNLKITNGKIVKIVKPALSGPKQV